MSESLLDLITAVGIPAAVIIWIVIGLSRLLNEQLPAWMHQYQDRKADKQEHSQTIEQQRLRHEELLALTEAGSRTYTEDQLTHHLSEVYVEFQVVNAFVREGVSVKLVRLESKIDDMISVTRDVAEMRERLAEIRMYIKSVHTSTDQVLKFLEENHKVEDE